MIDERLAGISDEELEAAHLTRNEFHEPQPIDPQVFAISDHGMPNVPTAEAIHVTPLLELPGLLRNLGELEARLRRDWWTAYQHYRHTFARWTLHYHQFDKLQISAAQLKAELDEDVGTAMVESRRCWEAVQTARRARLNVKAELRVRTTGADKPLSGVL